MAATLSTEPTSPAYHRDNNFVVLETDLIDLSPATIDLDFSDAPALTDTIEITWAGITITFTVEATTNDTATAIPEIGGGEALADYAQRVAEALRENDVLTADWEVRYLGDIGGGVERVRLQYRQPVELDITVSAALTDVVVTAADGEAATDQDNLAAYMQVFQAADDPNDDTRVVSLHAPYELASAQAVFDLKDILPLAPALPNPATIDQVISLTWPHDEAAGAWAKYYLRYAEKSGTPAVASALLKSSFYYMLHGARRGNWAEPPGLISAANIQHSYLREDGGSFQKPLSADQPDWVYVWTKQAITDCYVELQITWDNGDETAESPGFDPFDLEQYHLYWFAAGTAQINFASFTPPSGATEPVAYNWRLKGDWSIFSDSLIAQARFRIQCECHPWNLYLMLDNGLSGCESVHVRGRVKTKYEAERDTARRPRWTDYTSAIGDIYTFNAEGQQLIEINTGWHERYYIEHLRQMLLGHLWLIDTVNKRFLRVICDTKTIELHEDDQQLYALTLTLRAGWLDQAYHINP